MNQQLLLLVAAPLWLATSGQATPQSPDHHHPSGDEVGSHDLHAHHPSHHGAHGPDHFAPAGVMGAHIHAQGEWMVGLRVMRMSMDGIRDGSRDLDPTAWLGDPMLGTGYLNVPTSMTMDMAMLGGMYGWTDRLTLMAMVPFVEKDMTLVNNTGTSFSTQSSGIGDVSVGGLYHLSGSGHRGTMVGLQVSVPTGSVTERDGALGMGGAPIDIRLPYPMQIGSGTYDLKPSLAWTGEQDSWSFGWQATAQLPLGRNDEGYSLGEQWQATAWLAKRIDPETSVSLRLACLRKGNIDGVDETQGTPGGMPPAIALPNADPDLQALDRWDLHLGLNHVVSDQQRVTVEFGVPVYEHLDGPQMSTEWVASLGWHWVF